MDGGDDDISILPEQFEEDSSSTTVSVSPGLATFSPASSYVPASTHALQTAYQDLRNRFNELQQQNKALRRKTRSGSQQKMASENGFFSGSNGTPVDIREQGAAAMADSVLDDQVKQGHINHLQHQLKQTQAKYNIIFSELNRTQQQFDDFRSKHARCFQEKDDLYSQIRNIEIEKKKLIETVEKLKTKIENLMSSQNDSQSIKESSSRRLHTGKAVEENTYPTSFSSSQKGVCIVSVEEFEKLQEQMQLSQGHISTLQSLLEQQSRTLQALFGGQTLSDTDRRDLAAGLSHMTDLRLSLHGHGDTEHMDVEMPGTQLRRDSNSDLRFRLERQDQVRDKTDSLYERPVQYDVTDSLTESFIDNTKVKLTNVYMDNSNSALTLSDSLMKNKLSGNYKFPEDSSLELRNVKEGFSVRLPPPTGTSMTSNVKRQEAKNAVDRIVSAMSRASSTPQPQSYPLKVPKEPLIRTSSSPVHLSSSIPGAANDQQTSLTETKSPTLLDPVQPPPSNLSKSTLQLDPSKVPVFIPGQSFLSSETTDLKPGYQNTSIIFPSANATGGLIPSAVPDCLPRPQASENSTQEATPRTADALRMCPICGGEFSHLNMTEFQNHVFDCYDNTDSGEIERPDIASDNPLLNLSGQTNRKCPLCDAPFDNAIPHSVFERHVQEHFDEAPLQNEDFTILHPT